MATIDEVIKETSDNLNIKLEVKQTATKDAGELSKQLDNFKELKIAMDADPAFAAKIEFKLSNGQGT